MLTYIARRLLVAIPTLIVVSFLMFCILYGAGDPVASLRQSSRIDSTQLAKIIDEQGYNDPLLEQYGRWLKGFVTGDWGISTQDQTPALDTIADKLPATLELMGLALLLTIVLAVPIGIISAVKPYSIFDNTATGFSYLGYAFPTFFIGLLLQIMAIRLKQDGWGVMVVALGALVAAAGLTALRERRGQLTLAAGALLVVLGIVFWTWNQGEFLFFTAQRFSPRADEEVWSIDHLQHLVLPVVTLAVVSIASWSRFLRSSMFDVLKQDYVRTAKAKGLGPRRVIYRHALRNGLLPLITIMAIDAAALFAGAVVTEAVFAWPGIGTRFLEAVKTTDIPVSMAIVMLGAIMVVLFNLLADLGYAVADPRIRLS